MLKKMFLVFICLIVLFIVTSVLAIFFYERPGYEKPIEVGPPVATVEYIDPTKDHRNGSIRKITYPHGVITISRDYIGHFNLSHDSLFLEIKTHWPDFEKGHEFSEKPPMKYLRIMLQIRRRPSGKPKYNEEYSYKNISSSDLDWRYSGLVGYHTNFGWRYEALDLKNPDEDPIVVSCSEDNNYGPNAIYKMGTCRYRLSFDRDLYMEIRFNKPLMHDFIRVHKDLMEFIETIKESN